MERLVVLPSFLFLLSSSTSNHPPLSYSLSLIQAHSSVERLVVLPSFFLLRPLQLVHHCLILSQIQAHSSVERLVVLPYFFLLISSSTSPHPTMSHSLSNTGALFRETISCITFFLLPLQFIPHCLILSRIQAHSSVERACLLGGVHYRKVNSDSGNAMCHKHLELLIEEDIANGFIPFYVSRLHNH